MMCDISVIMPVYQKVKYLRKSIESVINSCFQGYELICIDDCSIDGSVEILKEYESKYDQIKVLYNKQNLGVADTRNRGIEEAKGKYIVFLDADDMFEKNALRMYYTIMEMNKAQMGFLRFVQDGAGVLGIKNEYDGVYSGMQLLDLFVENDEDFLYACGVMYERKFLEENQIKFEKLRIGEGGLFILNSLMKVDRAVVSDYPGYRYLINETSTSKQNFSMVASATGQLNQILFLFRCMMEYPQKKDNIIHFLNWYIPKNIGGILNLNEINVSSITPNDWMEYVSFMTKMLRGDFIFSEIRLEKRMENIIQKTGKVYLYGAGYDILAALRYCHQMGVEVCGVLVTSASNNVDCVYGYKVQEFRKGLIEDVSIPVIITARKKHQEQIEKLLLKSGIKYIAKI